MIKLTYSLRIILLVGLIAFILQIILIALRLDFFIDSDFIILSIPSILFAITVITIGIILLVLGREIPETPKNSDQITRNLIIGISIIIISVSFLATIVLLSLRLDRTTDTKYIIIFSPLIGTILLEFALITSLLFLTK